MEVLIVILLIIVFVLVVLFLIPLLQIFFTWLWETARDDFLWGLSQILLIIMAITTLLVLFNTLYKWILITLLVFVVLYILLGIIASTFQEEEEPPPEFTPTGPDGWTEIQERLEREKPKKPPQEWRYLRQPTGPLQVTNLGLAVRRGGVTKLRQAVSAGEVQSLIPVAKIQLAKDQNGNSNLAGRTIPVAFKVDFPVKAGWGQGTETRLETIEFEHTLQPGEQSLTTDRHITVAGRLAKGTARVTLSFKGVEVARAEFAVIGDVDQKIVDSEGILKPGAEYEVESAAGNNVPAEALFDEIE